MVLEYAKGGNFENWINKRLEQFDWSNKLLSLSGIINHLKIIHEKQMVHRDFHTGNLLVNSSRIYRINDSIKISDMGLCGEVGNIDETKIYGVMPYVAPEVLRGEPYTQAADIYSFGMIMYFVATEKQPFSNCAHDNILALNICNGVRPEINEPEAPKCYIDLMKRCWDSNPDNRPNAVEVYRSIDFFNSCQYHRQSNEDITRKQFEEADKYRKTNLSSIKNKQSSTHPQAIYTSQLLNRFTKDLPKYDNIYDNTVEVTDFTK
jgi:serine/threonine protein kinase